MNWHPSHTLTHTHISDLSSSACDIWMHLYLPVASIASFWVGILVATTLCLCYVCASRKTYKKKPAGISNPNFILNTTISDDVVYQNPSSASVLSASDPTPQLVSQCAAESMSHRYENVPAPKATGYVYVPVVPLESNIAYIARKSSTGTLC